MNRVVSTISTRYASSLQLRAVHQSAPVFAREPCPPWLLRQPDVTHLVVLYENSCIVWAGVFFAKYSGVEMRTYLLVAVLVALPMQAQAEFWSGSQLVSFMRAYQKMDEVQVLSKSDMYRAGEFVGYMTAAADAYALEGVICPASNIKTQKVSVVVADYLKANPADLRLDAIQLVRSALKDAFPCE